MLASGSCFKITPSILTTLLIYHIRRLCDKSPFCKNKECKCYDALSPLLDAHAEAWTTEAFLRGKERFVISDDWVIKPASTSSLLSLAQAFGSDFEEVQVRVGGKEVMKSAKMILVHILTSVLLGVTRFYIFSTNLDRIWFLKYV